MADKDLLLVPGVAARIATWAAQDGKADAIERGDAAAGVLAAAGLWGWGGNWSLAKLDYDASLGSTRLAFWQSGEGLKNAPLLDSALQRQAEELYIELYPGLMTTWAVLRGTAVAAASSGLGALAVLRGAAAAKAAVAEGVWSLVDFGTYLALPEAAKVAFWAGGADGKPSAQAPTPGPAPTPKPAPAPAPSGSGLGLFLVLGIVGAGGWAAWRKWG